MRRQLKEKEEERRKEEGEGLAQIVAKKVSAVEGEKSDECTEGEMKADAEGDVSGNEDENVSTLEWSEA